MINNVSLLSGVYFKNSKIPQHDSKLYRLIM